MEWREQLIAESEFDIAFMKRSVERMEKRLLTTGSLNAGGELVDTTRETIDHYNRIITELEDVVRKMRTDRP